MPLSMKPNIIFILADDLGYGDLGCYGQKRIKTPNIDQMAIEGMRFKNHYSGSTVCAPSRASLMTGLDTGNSYIRGNDPIPKTFPLRPQDLTVAEVLKKSGYSTAMIGKWGLGDSGTTGVPNKQGFDFFFGYLNHIRAHNAYPDYLWRNYDTIMLPNEVLRVIDGYAKGLGTVSTNKKVFSNDLFTEEAISYIKEKGKRETPFFLYLAYTIPHANNEYWLMDDHGMEAPDTKMYDMEDWPLVEKAKAAVISRMDGYVGQILHLLKSMQIDENTLVLFSSDNGPHAEGEVDPGFFDSNKPFKGIKRDLYEGGLRVPFIARWPKTITAGTTSGHISTFWDFMPTCAEIAQINIDKPISGLSYLPTLLSKEKDQKQHDYLYWEFHEMEKKQAIIHENWKLVYLHKTKTYELYNLAKDSGENNNALLANPKVFEKLKNKMQNARTPSEEFSLSD